MVLPLSNTRTVDYSIFYTYKLLVVKKRKWIIPNHHPHNEQSNPHNNMKRGMESIRQKKGNSL